MRALMVDDSSEKEKKKGKGIKHDYFLHLITYIKFYKDT